MRSQKLQIFYDVYAVNCISSLSVLHEANAYVDYSLIGDPFIYRCMSTQSTITERVAIAFDF